MRVSALTPRFFVLPKFAESVRGLPAVVNVVSASRARYGPALRCLRERQHRHTTVIVHSFPPGRGGYSRKDCDARPWRELVFSVRGAERTAIWREPLSLCGAEPATGHMNCPSTQELDDFRRRYPIRPPTRSSDHPHEDIQLEAEHGFRLLAPAPALDVLIGTPPRSRFDSESGNRYLWVVDQRGIPYIIEERLLVIGSEVPKHTNLTGGGRAYLGGEIWFASEDVLYLSGGSGRYPPSNSRQLEAAAQVFESFGYEARSLGWNPLTGMARRFWEDPAW